MATLEFGPIAVTGCAASVRSVAMPLARKTNDVLRELVRRRGQPCSRAELLLAAWPDEATGARKLDTQLCFLRRALRAATSEVTVESPRHKMGVWLAIHPQSPSGLLVMADGERRARLRDEIARVPVSLAVVETCASAFKNAGGPWAFALIEGGDDDGGLLRALRARNPSAPILLLVRRLAEDQRELARELELAYMVEPVPDHVLGTFVRGLMHASALEAPRRETGARLIEAAPSLRVES